MNKLPTEITGKTLRRSSVYICRKEIYTPTILIPAGKQMLFLEKIGKNKYSFLLPMRLPYQQFTALIVHLVELQLGFLESKQASEL